MLFVYILLAFITSEAPQASYIGVGDLKTGHIILVPKTCGLCKLIVGEENSVFSHAGLIVREKTEVSVLEVGLEVQKTKFDEFFKQVPKDRPTAYVVSPKAKIDADKLLKIFEEHFKGLKYDEYFLWDNKIDDKEVLYCTEFLYKILKYFTNKLPEPKQMHYDYHPDEWIEYFAKRIPTAEVPIGKLGLSPGDFERFRGFDVVGTLLIPKAPQN